MKVIIDIDEKLFKSVKERTQDGYIGSDVWIAVSDGTPITDGDLISRSALRKQIKSYADDQYAENEYLGECAILEFIDNAPAIGDSEE